MTTTALDPQAISPEPGLDGAARGGRLRWAIADARTLTWRNLLRYVRIPDSLFFSTVQPVMFVLLFRFVFGGAIHIPGVPYVDYLIAGIYVQTVMFGTVSTSVGLAEDLHLGLIERFRALPMARSAVLAGRTTADLVRNVGVMLVITAVGYAVGYRVLTSPLDFVLAFLVVLFFAYSMSWGFATIGLMASNSETAQLAAFPVLFPLTFASSAFVPVTTMPGWLQAFAKHQPVTQVVDASRQLLLGDHPGLWSTTDIWLSLAWSVGLLVVLAPLAVWRYRRTD
jgi:ABC-2 type transport system permease protein/oleandomycin transport system permease protein